MKVQLIVVQGKPEGKTIPLVGPHFKIGRGETCHLRPNSEQVSREHAEFTVEAETVSVVDLGSRNGTLVNGRAIDGPQALKDGDLVQVGPLTFAVSIQGQAAPVAARAVAPAPEAAAKPKTISSLDDVSNDEIDAWLVADKEKPTPESPSGVYGGDTITISAFKEAASLESASAAAPTPAAPAEETDEEYERLDTDEEPEADEESEDDDEEAEDEMPEDFMDESNPFYVNKKKKKDEPADTAKQSFKDTSGAASDILKKLMERRKQK